MRQDLLVGVTLICHHSSTDLAQTYTMSPACTCQDKVAILVAIHYKCATIQVALAQPFADLQFLTNHHRALATHNLHLVQTSRWSTLDRYEVEYLAEIDTRALADDVAEFLLGVFNGPTIEVLGLLVVVVENLAEDRLSLVCKFTCLCRRLKLLIIRPLRIWCSNTAQIFDKQ